MHVIFGVRSSLPDLKPTKTVVTRILATIPAARETPDRARGATAAQLSVKVEALCRRERSGSLQPKSRAKRETRGFESRRVHSPICGGDLYGGENAEIISPSNLTLSPPPRILKLTEGCTTFLMTPDIRGHLRYHQPDKPFGPVLES